MGQQNTTVKERLETALGSRVTGLESMPVGFGLIGFKADLADGRRLAVKARLETARVDLRLEAYMLGELARHSDLPVPAIHLSEPNLLVMDFIETDSGGITASVERHAAELLAALHASPRPFFGYERDTLIGPLPQPNPRSDRWIPFFRDYRLLAMARAAKTEGRLPAKYVDLAPKFITRADGTSAWLYEGAELGNIALNSVAGRPPDEYGMEPTSFDEIRPGCWDIAERVAAEL